MGKKKGKLGTVEKKRSRSERGEVVVGTKEASLKTYVRRRRKARVGYQVTPQRWNLRETTCFGRSASQFNPGIFVPISSLSSRNLLHSFVFSFSPPFQPHASLESVFLSIVSSFPDPSVFSSVALYTNKRARLVGEFSGVVGGGV